MDKQKLFQQIEFGIREQIVAAERARKDSQDEANRHIGRMQSRYDTFKEEAQQMAAAHEMRKLELNKDLEPVQHLLNNKAIKASCIIARLDAKFHPELGHPHF